MLTSDEVRFAIEDARTRHAAIVDVIFKTDEAAMTLLTTYLTLALATASGMLAEQVRQNQLSNDLSNSSTPGYKVDHAVQQSFGSLLLSNTATGQQIGPQQGGLPPSNGGFYTDPKTGVLTPKNNNGDYYTLGPDGKKTYFDHTGAPITEQQYNAAHIAAHL